MESIETESALFALGLFAATLLMLEFPRLGLVRVDSFDQVLVDLRQSLN